MGKKRRNRIILGIGVGILVALIVAGYFPKGYFISGFGGTHNHKTLWDWLNLAGVVAVPLVLAWFGFRLQLQQQKRNEDQAKLERDIADENRHEEILQNYFNRVSELLEKDLVAISIKESDVTSEEKKLLRIFKPIIRAITLSTIRRLDSQRNKSLTQFLLEAHIIPNLVSFSSADLNGANLSGATLAKVDLFRANLRGANLERAGLFNTNLESADLRDANLKGANLIWSRLNKAKLNGANLFRANLEGARLERAILICANFSGANLVEADLSGTKGLTKEQLEGEEPPYLCHTKLPEGIDIDPNRDCERYSDRRY